MTEYEKVEDTIFKFENVGDELEGVLIAVEDGANYGNKVYKIKCDDDKTRVVFGTTVLMSQMSVISIGERIKIVREKDKPHKKAGMNPIKVFSVYRGK